MLGDLLAIGCALAWALAVLAFRELKEFEPTSVNFFKNVVASVLLLLTMLAMGVPFDTERSALDWGALVLSGLLGLAVADTLFLAGLRRIDASVAAIADCAYSPTVLVLSSLVLGEVLHPALLLGAPLVVLGLAIVSWEGSLPWLTAKSVSVRKIDRVGFLLAVLGVITTAIGVVLAKGALDRSHLLEATTIRLCAGSVGILAFGLGRGRVRELFTLFRPQPAWKPAFVATLLGTYISMLLWLGGMKYGTTSRAALLNQLGAVFVLILSALAGETVPLRRWLGASVAILGVAVVLLA